LVPSAWLSGQAKAWHQEFLGFLRQIEKPLPDDLEVHLIVDNDRTHKHNKILAWLAQRPRFYVLSTPTYASWLNQVQRWFGRTTQRGSFSSVQERIDGIVLFVAA
jgi:putative transposase